MKRNRKADKKELSEGEDKNENEMVEGGAEK